MRYRYVRTLGIASKNVRAWAELRTENGSFLEGLCQLELAPACAGVSGDHTSPGVILAGMDYLYYPSPTAASWAR